MKKLEKNEKERRTSKDEEEYYDLTGGSVFRRWSKHDMSVRVLPMLDDPE